jgi:hypothetical protein
MRMRYREGKCMPQLLASRGDLPWNAAEAAAIATGIDTP